MQEAHDPYGALRHPAYRRLLAGNVLFSLGAEMQTAAVYWEIWQRTKNPLALGLTGLTQFLPVLLLSIPAGQAADRFNRKRLLLAAQSLALLTSLSLAALSYWQVPVFWIYPSLFMVGVARAFTVPARWALVPQVVPPGLIGNAVTWNSSGWQLATITGPALGGLVLAATLPAIVYLGTALCAFTCVLFISTVHLRPVPPPTEVRSWSSLLAGLRFVWQSKPILATITLDLFAVLLGGATALLPIFAEKILEVGPQGFGWLRAAPALGALAMAFVLAHHPPLRHAGKMMLIAVAGFGVATIIFGFSEGYPLSFVMLAITGALDNISVVVRQTLVQGLTPDSMRGRVTAVNTIFISSSNELGGFESGATAQLFGPVTSVVMGGIGTVLVVAIVMAWWPDIVNLGLSRPAGVTPPDQESAAAEELEG